MYAGVLGRTYGEKVTGTNVNVVLAGGCAAVVPKGDDWHSFTMIEYKVTVGDVTLDLPPSNALYRVLRIASTHFAHNSNIDFGIVATFYLSRPGESKIVVVNVTPSIKSYNRFAGMGTTKGTYNADPTVQAELDTLFSEKSQNLVLSAKTQHQNMNHQNMTGSEMKVREPDVKDAILGATSFAALIHGSVYGMMDSYSRFETEPGFCNFGADIAPWRGSRTSDLPQPSFNVVGLWSCDTLDGGAVYGPSAFGISASAVDQAYLGFDVPVRLNVNNPVSLDEC